ncbi:MAG: hypothetical protein V1917_02345 [Candidatus Gottesmanbacteria bacterium]
MKSFTQSRLRIALLSSCIGVGSVLILCSIPQRMFGTIPSVTIFGYDTTLLYLIALYVFLGCILFPLLFLVFSESMYERVWTFISVILYVICIYALYGNPFFIEHLLSPSSIGRDESVGYAQFFGISLYGDLILVFCPFVIPIIMYWILSIIRRGKHDS